MVDSTSGNSAGSWARCTVLECCGMQGTRDEETRRRDETVCR